MPRSNNKLVFKILSRIVCLIGCVLQSYKISEYYFSYETITNVKYETENQIDLPGITIAYSKPTQLSENERQLNNARQNNHKTYTEFQMNGTIEDQRKLFGKSPSRLQQCFYHDNDYKILSPCSIKFSNATTTSFSGHLFGVSIFKQSLDEPDQRFIIMNSLNDFGNNILVIISIKKNMFNTSKDVLDDLLAIQLHNRKDFLFEPHMKGSLLVNIRKTDMVMITYRKTIVKYLFVPRSYPCSNGESKEQCIYYCKRDSFISKFNSYPYFYMIPIDQEESSNLKFSTSQEFNLFNNTKNCIEKCSHYTDCYKEYLIFRGKEAKHYNDVLIFCNNIIDI